MDHTRILTILCGFLLLICLVLSIVALTVMRNATDESLTLRTEAYELLDALDASVEAMNKLEEKENSIQASTKEDEAESNGGSESLCIRAEKGRVGVYTNSGRLIHILDLDLSSLPANEREALENGISVKSWKELIKLIEDYTQ